jgi:peptide/nickel transport system ATP-binding protein
MTADVLDIRGLSLRFDTQQGAVYALRNVSMTVPRGEIVGVVGESGSGKSTLALAIMRLLSSNAVISAGAIVFCGSDLRKLPEDEMRAIQGTRISMVFQDPMTSLNPVRSIGQQMTDIQYRDRAASTAHKRAKSVEALQRVGIPDAASQLDRFPFQFSGGMRQRIAIAMSLLQKPELLIADEITTALDVTLEAQILHLLRQLRKSINGSILFISHNLGAIAEICDRVVVLYAGEVVESGPVGEIFNRPQHPYTKALIACDPARIETITRELPIIPGEVPNLHRIPEACIFAPRCAVAIDRCHAEPPADVMAGPSHRARCRLVGGAPT